MPAQPRRFRHAALVGKYRSDGSGALLRDVAEFVAARGLEVSVERETAVLADFGTRFAAIDAEAIGARCDLAVVVGGDGTMLGIARRLAPHGVPLVGINAGRLGFITDVRVEGFREALGPILDGDHECEERSMLEGDVMRAGASVFDGLAMNDVIVGRGATAGMVELRVDIGDEFVANIRADGLIVATPTGSTAYALSAGGPILHPRLGGWVLVPIASHTLSNRPIVLPDTAEVRITVVAGRDASVNFDMQGLASMHHGDEVRVRRSPHRVTFVHPRGWSYYATLRRKLRWHEGTAG